MKLASLLPLLALGCAPEATPLPTEAAVAALDPGQQPPLYQLLYDAPALPEFKPAQQRVRLLIWLQHMAFTPEQLQRLDELRLLVADRQRRLSEAEAELLLRYEAEETRIYEQIWMSLSQGAPVDAPEMAAHTEALRQMRGDGQRERELLQLRLEGLRSILEAERPLLRSLSPRQELLLADALFFLRGQLDPVANPGDFRALVGSVYDPGQYAVLTRGTSDISREPLNIGALWSEQPGTKEGALHEARREVLLLLALLEPGLDEAIKVARKLASRTGPAAGPEASQAPAPGPGGSSPPAAPPGLPAAAPPGSPMPAPPGAPGPSAPGAPAPQPASPPAPPP